MEKGIKIKPSPRDIAEGIQMCIKNAEDFIESAFILFRKNKFRQSYILNSFAQEELGKILSIWNSMYYSDDKTKWASWKRRFYDHNDKIWFSKDVNDLMMKKLPENINSQIAKQDFEKRKKIIYVDIKDLKFIFPEDVQAEDVGKGIKDTKQKLLYHKKIHSSVEIDIKNIKNQFLNLSGKSYQELKQSYQQKIVID